MKRLLTFESFLNEQFEFKFGAVKDPSKRFAKASAQLEAAGYKVWNTDSSSHPTGDTSSTSLIFVKPGEPKAVKLSLHIGRTARENSFYSSTCDVPADVTSERMASEILKDRESSMIDILSAAKFMKSTYEKEVRKMAEEISKLSRKKAESYRPMLEFAEKREWDLQTNMWYLHFMTKDSRTGALAEKISAAYKANHRIGYIDFNHPQGIQQDSYWALSDISQFPINSTRKFGI